MAGALIGMAALATAPSALAQAQDPSQPPAFTVIDGSIDPDGGDSTIVLAVTNCSSAVLVSGPIVVNGTLTPPNLEILVKNDTQSGTYPITLTCDQPGQPPLNADITVTRGTNEDDGDKGTEEIGFRVTDGAFTDEDPRVAFEVIGCDSNDVTAKSSIFSSTSYDEESDVVTAKVEQGTESGTYELTITCEGQPTLKTEIEINGAGSSGRGGGGGGSTPRGGVDTGFGGTAGGSPAAAGVPPAAGWLLLLPLLGAAVLILLRRRDAAGR